MFRSIAVATVLMTALVPVQAQERPTVVAVNYALSYFAQRLGGSDVDVLFPVPAGTDPSFWRPGIADIGTIQRADLILLNGAGFATWTTKTSLPRARTVDTSRGFSERLIATESITHSHGADGEHSHTGTASFTWLDPELAVLQARAIADAFARRGLGALDEIDGRLTALSGDLLAIHAEAGQLRSLGDGMVLIATHPRYQYLARAYGLEIRSLEWEAGAAPDAEQLARLAALVDETGARILLWEARPPEPARTAVRALGLADTVFPTLATAPEGADYLETLRRAVDDLARVLAAGGG